MSALGRWRTPSTSPTGVRTRTYGLTGLPPRRNAPFGVGERDSTPLHAKGGLEEFGRLVGDAAQSAGAMQVNHRGVAADAGFCRSAPGALRVSFARSQFTQFSRRAPTEPEGGAMNKNITLVLVLVLAAPCSSRSQDGAYVPPPMDPTLKVSRQSASVRRGRMQKHVPASLPSRKRVRQPSVSVGVSRRNGSTAALYS